MNDILVFLQLVALVREGRVDQAKLVLAGSDLVMVLVHIHAQFLHRGKHFRTHVLSGIDRVHGEISSLNSGTMSCIPAHEFGVGIPRRIFGIHDERNLVHRVRKSDVVEHEEFGFRSEKCLVADSGRFQIGFCLFGRPARVAFICFARVRLDDGAVQASRLLRVERVEIERFVVGHQFHVRSLDRLPAGDRRAVEHHSFFQHVLVERGGDQCHMLQLSARIRETQIDVFTVLFLDCRQYFVCFHSDFLLFFKS